jgi:hypothetical protein
LRARSPAKPYIHQQIDGSHGGGGGQTEPSHGGPLDGRGRIARGKQAQEDWLNEQMRMESHTEVEYKAADEAMDAYYEITGGDPEKNGGSAGCGARADLGRFLYPLGHN